MSDLLKKVEELFGAEESELLKLASDANTRDWIVLMEQRNELLTLQAAVLDLIREDLKNED